MKRGIIGVFIMLICNIGFSKHYAFFPFCPSSTQSQSERLNNLHSLMLDAADKVSVKKANLLGKDFKNAECELSKRRNLAALLNAEEFMEGKYILKNDSVILQIRFVFTQFIDKFTEEKKLSGKVDDMNTLIKNAIISVFKEVDIHPTPEEWMLINALVKEDEKKYAQVQKTEEVDYFGLGMTAYKLGKYQEAKDFLANVLPTHANFAEASFFMAKSLLYFSDFSNALTYLNICKEKNYKTILVDEYINSVKKLNLPADYYDTEEKRKHWWISLQPNEINQVIQMMNNLKINGKSYDDKYVYEDKDFIFLFNTTILAFSDFKIQDFNIFKHFTKVDLVIFQNSTVKSDAGFDNFVKLKMIRTDNAELLKKDLIAKVISEKSVKTFLTNKNQ